MCEAVEGVGNRVRDGRGNRVIGGRGDWRGGGGIEGECGRRGGS